MANICLRTPSTWSRHFSSPSLQKYVGVRAMKSTLAPSVDPSRVYILGVGNLGRLFAHALAKSASPPPITLLLHRSSILGEWEKVGRKIEIITNGVSDTTKAFDTEVISPSSPQSTISNLIIATKTLKTVSALSAVKDRLTSNSTVLFTQNGMGTLDEVTEEVFPDVSLRPEYLVCITSHGVYSQGPFRSVHAGLAHCSIGRVGNSSAPQYLIDLITRAPVLSAKGVSPPELLKRQLEKLVINSMINPLTAIFNCQNGELFIRSEIVTVMRSLIGEASHVIRSLPELRDDHDTASRFSPQNLETVVLDIAEKTAKNTSSMLQDVRAKRETEIDYMNGYIVKRGKEVGIECPNNEILVKMVKEGKVIVVDEASDYFTQPEHAWEIAADLSLYAALGAIQDP